ncbi:MAG: SusC/RagA family TonB-linked outer membrane protein, partial [Flectobacillus sp.]|nr:SusC/RagA family TonB-linked outer membrane protein [Flectobacillus sp.]
MKITAIQLVIAMMVVGVSFARPSYAQEHLKDRITLTANKSSLRAVLRDIEKQVDIVFSYQKDVLASKEKVSISFKDETVESILNVLLNPRNINFWVLKNNQIILTQRTTAENPATLLPTVPKFTEVQIQEVTITGTIVDSERGEPLAGVNVFVKGTQKGTTSDARGKYAISVSDKDDVLVFSSIGYEKQEVAILKRILINVSMKSGNQSLDEVVVIGYGKAKRSEITTSISSISEKEIKNLPVAGIDQAMQGKVAGVTISSNGGQPGGGISVRVRGITSVNGNEPLYVIDGVPMQGSRSSISQDQLGGQAGQSSQSPLAALNPNDIVSIDVLKDASAQAIYGSRAANGVVVITTKSGKIGESKISYEVYYGQQTVPKKLSLLNLSQFAAYQNSLAPEINSSGIGFLTPIEEFADPSVLGAGTNWQDAVFRKGIIKNHQLAFSGGQNKTSYYFSVNYFGQEGTVIGSDFERFALRTSIDHQVKSW